MSGSRQTQKIDATLPMVSSVDGIIANSVSWLNSSGDVYEKGVSHDRAEQVVEAIDCLVLGSRTYEHELQLVWRYGDPTVVISNREMPATRKSVEFYSR